MRSLILAAIALAVIGSAIVIVRVNSRTEDAVASQPPAAPVQQDAPAGEEVAIFGNGCFWCTEAVFLQLKGVKSVTSGYSGGKLDNPTYDDICTGVTGHAEVVRIVYDPKTISYKDLLEAFWISHDPTTLNRQGKDRGTQYRSVIFFVNDQQKKLADESKRALDAAGVWNDPIVTEIRPAAKFYPAEAYHQDFYANNPGQGYCEAVIPPKIAKVRKALADKVK